VFQIQGGPVAAKPFPKIQLAPPAAKDFEVSARGTSKTDDAKLLSTLKTAMKDNGKYGERASWWVLL